MAGTARVVDGRIVFVFPYDAEVNSRLRDAAGNKARWDSELRGFTVLVSSIRRDPAIAIALARFIMEHEITADAAACEL